MGLGLTRADGIIPGLFGTIEFELCCVRLQGKDLMQKKERKKTKEKKKKAPVSAMHCRVQSQTE